MADREPGEGYEVTRETHPALFDAIRSWPKDGPPFELHPFQRDLYERIARGGEVPLPRSRGRR